MTDTTIDCSAVSSVILQRKENALYNIPPNRYSLQSPYPSFSQTQLNMRRKVEILKYTNNGQGSAKGNRLSKNQEWSILARGSGNSGLSQNAILSSSTSTTTCIADELKITSNDKCDVPGPLIYLQYDPTVPLYNFTASTPITSGLPISNSNGSSTDIAIWKAYTTNTLFFDDETLWTFVQDLSTNTNYTYTVNTQTRTWKMGVISITKNMSESSYIFSLSAPISLWCVGAYGNVYDSSYNNVYAYGEVSDIDISFSIISQSVKVLYNDVEISLQTEPTIIFSPIDVSLSLTSLDRQFYFIQYVGMLYIDNLILATTPGYLYNVDVTISYSYGQTETEKFDLCQTGIYTNVTEVYNKVTHHCTLTSDTPSDYAMSSFIQFPNR
jgi:hypothetical protein